MIGGFFSGLADQVTGHVAGQVSHGTLDARARVYSDWILANVCKGDKNAIVGMAVEINPRVDGFGIFGSGVFHTECRSMNWDAGYITVQGGDYGNAEELYVQRAAKINGVSIPML